MIIDYYVTEPLRPGALEVIRAAKAAVFGDAHVRLNPVDKKTVLHLDNDFLIDYPLAQTVLERRFTAYKRHPFGEYTLYLDIESHSVDDRWRMPVEEFFRLGQWAIGDGSVETTTDLDTVLDLIHQSPGVVAHNGHSFDFSQLLGDDALPLSLDNRLFDTKVHAALALPAPHTYVNRHGRKVVKANKPENAQVWLSLDNLCFQLGLHGKEGDLKALAKEFGGFGNIPTDDPRFLTYAVQDVDALRELTGALLELLPLDDYGWREQQNAAIDAQNMRNGFTVDVAAAQARVDTFNERKQALLTRLENEYDFPTTGKSPWASKDGKQALLSILADHGITPETKPDWKRTPAGALSLAGDVLIELTQGTEAEELGQSLAQVMGQRSLPQLALDCVQPDGKVHPEISALQRSGRKSTTKPGLTVWGSHGEKSDDKAYFIPEEGCSLVGFDYSNADQRALAAMSGDQKYAERFLPGVDGHEINGRIMFTDEVYDSNPKFYRNESKAPGHAYTYGGQARKLALTTGLPLEIMERFVQGMEKMYPVLTSWQNTVRREAKSGFIVNAWGRRMVVDRGREYTQAPALLGQGATREIVVDALLRIARYDVRYIKFLRAQVHDELIFSIPDDELDVVVPKIQELMRTVWNGVEFTVGVGGPAKTWREANHD